MRAGERVLYVVSHKLDSQPRYSENVPSRVSSNPWLVSQDAVASRGVLCDVNVH